MEGMIESEEDRYLKTEGEVVEILNSWKQELRDAKIPCGIELSKEFDQYGLFRRQWLELRAQDKISLNAFKKVVLI